MKAIATFTMAAAALTSLVEAASTKVNPNKPPHQIYPGEQFGYNDCANYKDSATSKCQDLWINSLDDFCLFAPPSLNSVGESERYQVSYCSKAGHGTRLFPKGTITGATLVRTKHYIQITGKGDFTKLNIKKGDYGGELDPHGYDKKGNPVGGLVFGNQENGKLGQFMQWTEFISHDTFCIRACYPSQKPDDYKYCGHRWDEMGCGWNMPGTYQKGKFETCKGKDTEPMGIYVNGGKTTTWYQGEKPTPTPHPAGASSQCSAQKTLTVPSYPKATTTKKASPKRQVEVDSHEEDL